MEEKSNLQTTILVSIIIWLYIADFISSSTYLEASSPIYALILISYILFFKLTISDKIYKMLVWSCIILLTHSITKNILAEFQNIVVPYSPIIKWLVIIYCKIYITISIVKYLFDKEMAITTPLNWQTIISLATIILLYVSDFLLANEYLPQLLPSIMIIFSLIISFCERHTPIIIQKMLLCSLLINIAMQSTPTSLNNFFDDISTCLPIIKWLTILYLKIRITISMVQYLVDTKKSRG